jgi:hypothetical protein
MNMFVSLSVFVYVLGILGWLFIWKVYNGYKLMKEKKPLILIFLMTILVLGINGVLTLISPIPPYETELKIYEYVEVNSRVIATMALAIAVFAYYALSTIKRSFDLIKNFLFYIICGFIMVMIGVFPLYWMPANDGWLTVLRHIKTVFYTYSLFSISAAMIVFIYSVMDRFSVNENETVINENKKVHDEEQPPDQINDLLSS